MFCVVCVEVEFAAAEEVDFDLESLPALEDDDDDDFDGSEEEEEEEGLP